MTSIIPIIPNNFSWTVYRMPRPLNFWVYRSVVDTIQFFRPYEPINNQEFEEFFHFGAHCSGYDSDRVVIKNSQKPRYKPVTPVIITKEGHWKLK